MSSKTSFGPKVAHPALKKQGRKSKWLAGECGFSREHVSLVLNGHREASDDFIEKVSAALNIDVPTKAGTKARAS